MAIDWDKFQNELTAMINAAEESTDEKLAERISSITRMTDEEVKELFPESADIQKLAELMEIVKRDGDKNDKINKIVTNAEKFGGIILTLLRKFA
jgi:hypothetical protein